MQTPHDINFDTFYFQELLKTIHKKGSEIYDKESQTYLEKLIESIGSQNTAQESIEKLAAFPSTSDLAIFFSDILDQLSGDSPEEAIGRLDNRAADFLEIFEIYLQNDEWKAALDKDLAAEAYPQVPVAPSAAAKEDAVSLEEFCAHWIEETIQTVKFKLPEYQHSDFVDYLYAFQRDTQLAESLKNKLNDRRAAEFARLNALIAQKPGMDDVEVFMSNFSNNVQQWANLFKDLLQTQSEDVHAIFYPVAEETPESQAIEIGEEDGERPFEELFEEVEEEFETTESIEDAIPSAAEAGKPLPGMEKLEHKPRTITMTEEELQRRKMLRDYVANEVSSLTEEVLETFDQLIAAPGDRGWEGRFRDSLKSLKDIGQIHFYPAVEHTADALLQILNQLHHKGQSFSEEEKPALEGIFGILPIYIDAAVENIDNHYLAEIQHELSELRSRLFYSEPLSDVKAIETMEAAFQDVVSRYARQINEYIAAQGNGASERALSPIFDNLSYWSNLLISQAATETIQKMQVLLNRPALNRLSGADRQTVSDIITRWENDFVNTPGNRWQNDAAKLDELLQKLEGVPITEALAAFQQVTGRQLSQLRQDLKSSAVNAAAFIGEKLPNFFAALQANGALIQNDALENLCRTLGGEIEHIETKRLSEEPALKGQLAEFLENLQENISSLPETLESERLLEQFRSLFAEDKTPIAPPAEIPEWDNEDIAIESAFEISEEESAPAPGITITEQKSGVESDIELAETAAETSASAPEEVDFEPVFQEKSGAPADSGGLSTDEEIIEVFNLEALNYINDLKNCFSRLKTNLEDKEAWRSLGITAHTLKGSAQMVGRPDIAELAEPLDLVVELVENDAIIVQTELVIIFDSLVEVMKEKIKDASVNTGPVIAQLRDYISLASKHAGSAARPAAKTRPAAGTVTTADIIYLKEQDPELLNIFQNEVSNNFDIVEKNLANLEKFTYDKEALQQVERAVHEIRAAAKMLGIGEIANISDKLEHIFEMLVLKKIDDLKGVLPFTRRSMMVIRELTTRHSVQKSLYDEIINHLVKITEGVSPAELSLNLTASSPQFTPADETEAGIAEEIVSEKIAPKIEETPVKTVFKTSDKKESESARGVAPQVLELYIQEAHEQLDDINYLLLKLEKDTHNEEMQHHLMRCMHTLKGSSAMVYAANIESLSHRCEDILERNIRENRSMEPALFDLLFEVMDEINYSLDALQESGEDKAQKHAELLKRLNEYYEAGEIIKEPEIPVAEEIVEAEAPRESALQTEETAETEPLAAGGKKETYLRLNINKMNHLLNLAAELVISNNQFKNQLDGLKKFNSIMNTNLKTFRDTEEFLSSILKSARNIQDAIEPLLKQQPAASGSLQEQLESLQRVLKNVKSLQDELTSVSHSLKENSKTYDENLQKMNKLSNNLLDEIMQARLVPINLLFQRFHRPIRDLAKQLKKQIRLSVIGEDTELDRISVDELYEPLLHIIRNAIDHGLETEEERKKSAKNPEGLLQIKASRDRNQVIIEISDDGKGIDLEAVKAAAIGKGLITAKDAESMNDQEVFEYLFYPGFSTAKETTLVSGRGVGLDAVKTQIDKAKGDIRIYTEKGKGTTFSIRVPISLSVIQSMLIDVSGHIYSVPLMQVDETLHASGQDLISENDQYFIRFRERKFPVVQLSRLLKVRNEQELSISPTINYPVIIVQDEGEKVALLVDKIIRREEILIKSLGPGLRRLKYISGGSIMGDGQVVLVLDIPQIIQDITKGGSAKTRAGVPASPGAASTAISPAAPRLRRETKRIEGRKPVALIVDDSLSIRKYLSSLLMQKGYITDTARNGYEALELLNKQEFDIMVTDLEMPKLSGYELIETLRYDPRFTTFPIIVLTGRAGENFRQLTTELGADAYVIKPFKDRELFEQIEKFINYQG